MQLGEMKCMRLKYVGPKPEISYSSISFNKCKEDKFVYIITAYQLLKSLDHDYEKCRSFTDTINIPCMSEDDLKDLLTSTFPDLETCVKKHQDALLSLFEKEIQQVKKSKHIDPVSKEAFLNNHSLMREYRLQRQRNKSVYYMLIQKLICTIREKQIEHIITPMHERYAYVLINVQKALMQDKTPLFTELEVFQHQNEFKTKLHLVQI